MTELAKAWDVVMRHMAHTTSPGEATSVAFQKVLDEFDSLKAVVTAAGEYIDECENPAPDLVYRRSLRTVLAREFHAWRRMRR